MHAFTKDIVLRGRLCQVECNYFLFLSDVALGCHIPFAFFGLYSSSQRRLGLRDYEKWQTTKAHICVLCGLCRVARFYRRLETPPRWGAASYFRFAVVFSLRTPIVTALRAYFRGERKMARERRLRCPTEQSFAANGVLLSGSVPELQFLSVSKVGRFLFVSPCPTDRTDLKNNSHPRQ